MSDLIDKIIKTVYKDSLSVFNIYFTKPFQGSKYFLDQVRILSISLCRMQLQLRPEIYLKSNLSERSLGKVDGHKLKNTSINKRFLLKVNGHGLKMTFQESIIGQAERGRTNLKIHAG